MQIQTEIKYAPLTQQFLYAPSNINTMVKGISQEHLDRNDLPDITLSYEKAKKLLEKRISEMGSIEVNTPVLLVFQGNYRGKLGKTKSLDYRNFVAAMYDLGYSNDRNALTFELATAFEAGIGIDFKTDESNQQAFLNRISMRPVSSEEPDISDKLMIFNSIAQRWERDSSNVIIFEGDILPKSIVCQIESIAYQGGLELGTDFKYMWDFVAEKHSDLLPSEEQIEKARKEQFYTHTRNLETFTTVLSELKDKYGLTEEESGLFNGVRIIAKSYRQQLGKDHADEMIAGNKIITLDGLAGILTELQGIRS